MLADMLSNEKFEPVLTKLFICGRKLNNSIVFITQSYFVVPQNIALNSTDYFILNKLHSITHYVLISNVLSKFMKNVLVDFCLFNDTTLSSENP